MMGKLQNLETLDLKGTNVWKLPSTLFKLQQLRHLIAYKVELETYSRDFYGFDGGVGIRRLVNLQELLYIDVDVYVRQGGRVVRELGELIQLRRLGVLGLRKEYGVELCSSIEKMKNLFFLDVTSSEGEVLDLQSLSSPPMLLQRLELSGNLEKFPNWISSLLNLKKLKLARCGLSDDPLGVLQALPTLVELTLCQTYDGEELCFKRGGFLTLEVLYFDRLERLKLVRVEEGAMPHLEELDIMACKMLEKVPLGIECLANLKFLHFAYMPKEFAMALNPTKLGGDISPDQKPLGWFTRMIIASSAARGVLKEADAREESKDWVNQVRDIVYDIEDTLDEFNLRLQQHQCHGFLGFLYKTIKLVKHLKPRHHLATQIQSIKSRVHDVYERRQRYEFNFHDQGSSSNALRDTWHDHRGDALHIKEDELVGIDKPWEKLIEWLVGGESRLEVISVYGMPGLGKTSLVKKVYDHQRVIQHFQHHVWINVSQSFKTKELIKDMIKQLYGEIKEPVPQGVATMDEDSLKTTVNVFLQQRGLYGHVYNLEALASEDSWTLFCKKAFGENSCRPELLGFSKNILKRCGGLPLAIVAICSFLSTKEKTMIEWEIVHRTLGSLLESNDKLENMKEILSLSYNDLPSYLKPCLLYLGFFPEDYLIEPSRLIKLWTAEGFVSEKGGLTIEEVAESHLHELINRSLIQVAETNWEGRVKWCRVHDFIREIILSKLRDQNCGVIITKQHTKLPQKVRWLSIHNSVDNVPENKIFSHLRSLFIFGVDTIPKSYVHSFFSSIRLLRVLDLRDAPLEKLPNEIVNLFYLRYLSLRRTKIKKLPKMIGKLQNLETLDLKGTSVRELPSKLFKIQQLRHLIAYKVEYSFYGFDGQVRIRRLVNLQELLYIDVDVYQGGRVVRGWES
ncbi:hypothetical protein HHK36_020337 [Tetracentron sinense]|uniref:NB-ARC domain-containing protein n=1 Tax=Tetracentron sinense TaxID=13715 RepID=A0A834YYU0_TETSI|nr:hypothetical protein HHK36_020337 [Tetracentron sinense]